MTEIEFTNLLNKTDARKWGEASLKNLATLVERLARKRIIDDARDSAKSYAESRNKRGTTPRSKIAETQREKEIRTGVETWLRTKRHGKTPH